MGYENVLRLLLAILIVLIAVETAKAEKRVALVIGNSSYTLISALANPKNDAELMASTLEDVGFEVVTAIDVDIRDMGRAVRKFGKLLRRAGKDAIGLLYYAGHGVQAKGINYLIPLGAELDSAADLDIEAMSASDILSQMEEAGNGLNIVILDACRNNPFKSNVRTAGRGLARIHAASGSFIAFSAGPGQVASDGDGVNSPYTASLVEAIKQPGLSVEQVFKRTRVRVKNLTGGKQTPWEESSLEGDFYFTPKTDETNPVADGPGTENSLEALFWSSVKESNDVAAFEAFLEKFPDGTFADLAELRIRELRRNVALAPPDSATSDSSAETAYPPEFGDLPLGISSTLAEQIKRNIVFPSNQPAQIERYVFTETHDGQERLFTVDVEPFLDGTVVTKAVIKSGESTSWNKHIWALGGLLPLAGYWLDKENGYQEFQIKRIPSTISNIYPIEIGRIIKFEYIYEIKELNEEQLTSVKCEVVEKLDAKIFHVDLSGAAYYAKCIYTTNNDDTFIGYVYFDQLTHWLSVDPVGLDRHLSSDNSHSKLESVTVREINVGEE